MHRVFLMSFSLWCISCNFKPTKRSKYMYCPLLYNERDSPLIQYTKNINGMALVDGIRKILEKYSLGQYRILFATCSYKVVDRKERKKLMINIEKKNNTIKQ